MTDSHTHKTKTRVTHQKLTPTNALKNKPATTYKKPPHTRNDERTTVRKNRKNGTPSNKLKPKERICDPPIKKRKTQPVPPVTNAVKN
jgi:hypothetical protein